MDHRQALWEISVLADRPQALFQGQPSASTTEIQVELPFISD
jgi:error-prone DNA polymerase